MKPLSSSQCAVGRACLDYSWPSHISLIWGRGRGLGGVWWATVSLLGSMRGSVLTVSFGRSAGGVVFPVACGHFSPHCNLRTLSSNTGLTWNHLLLPSPWPGSVKEHQRWGFCWAGLGWGWGCCLCPLVCSSGAVPGQCLDVGQSFEENQKGSATVQSYFVGDKVLLSKCDSALQ